MAEGAHLTEQVAILTTPVEDLLAENESYQERITTFQNDLNHEGENLVTPSSSFPVPDPERYDGNCKKLPLFRSHLLMKLQGDDA